jgi:hypothetical protein
VLSVVLAVLWVLVAGSTLLWGLDYYVLPRDAQAYSPLASIFSPTGVVGHGLGIVGTAMIVVGVVGYGVRKRFHALSKLGPLKHWLQVHIFLCTLGPFLVLLHTTFKFGGVVSIAFWSMTTVVASGVFGRYVYVRIPKAVNGTFLTLEAVRERAEAVATRIGHLAGTPAADLQSILGAGPSPAPASLTGALAFAMREDFALRNRRRKARAYLRSSGVPAELHGEILALARERARASQQAVLLRPLQRLFRYWHVFHLPLAMLMFAILGVHIAVAIVFGYTWIF